MSTYIKSLDPNHMVSVGDEGFLKREGAADWFYNGGEGVDWERLIVLPNIDFGTVHLYSDGWGKSADWGTQWIKDHTGQKKPVVLEEYGIKSNKESVYRTWCNTALKTGYAGTMFWILTGIQDDGSLYGDYDGFRVTYPSSLATILANHAKEMAGGVIPTPTVTGSPTPAKSPGVTPTPAKIGDFAVSYTQNDWGSGATVSITIKNNANTGVDGWTLGWSYSGNQKIVNLWNGGYSQNGASVTVKNNAGNGKIAANGGTVSFGFNITYSGSNPKPNVFTLNGSPCNPRQLL